MAGVRYFAIKNDSHVFSEGEEIFMQTLNGRPTCSFKNSEGVFQVLFEDDFRVVKGENFPEENKTPNDNVNHPSHYTSGKIEVIDFIEDQKLGFNRGNAIKYIARAGKKDPSKELEDLQKALFYIQREIKLVGGE